MIIRLFLSFQEMKSVYAQSNVRLCSLAFQTPSMSSEQLQVSSELKQTCEDDRETLSEWHRYFFEMKRPKPIKHPNLLLKKQKTTSSSEEPSTSTSGQKFDLDEFRFRCIESNA